MPPEKIRIQREYVREMRRLWRRGLLADKELKVAEVSLEQTETKVSRISHLEPPLGPKSVRVPMDRTTELALTYLMEQDPSDLDLDARLEKAEMFRIAICRWALWVGWEPSF